MERGQLKEWGQTGAGVSRSEQQPIARAVQAIPTSQVTAAWGAGPASTPLVPAGRVPCRAQWRAGFWKRARCGAVGAGVGLCGLDLSMRHAVLRALTVSRAPDRRHVSHWRWQVRLAWARRREREACTAFCVKVPRLSIPSSDAPYVPVNGPGAGPSKGLPAMHPRACFDPHIRPRATFSCTSLFDPLQSDPVCAIRSWRDDTDGAV